MGGGAATAVAVGGGGGHELATFGNPSAGAATAVVMGAGAAAAATAEGGRGLATLFQRAATINSPSPGPGAPTPPQPPQGGGQQAPGRGADERPASAMGAARTPSQEGDRMEVSPPSPPPSPPAAAAAGPENDPGDWGLNGMRGDNDPPPQPRLWRQIRMGMDAASAAAETREAAEDPTEESESLLENYAAYGLENSDSNFVVRCRICFEQRETCFRLGLHSGDRPRPACFVFRERDGSTFPALPLIALIPTGGVVRDRLGGEHVRRKAPQVCDGR